ncbi:MAG: hypothetical protein JRN21_09625 [Nitrososphaerota archaeon]|nr:hypothetical protein [Nitrososphaerota archaeon]
MDTNLGPLEREVLWFLCGMGEATSDEMESLVRQHRPYNILMNDAAQKRNGVRFDKVLKRLEQRNLIQRVEQPTQSAWYSPTSVADASVHEEPKMPKEDIDKILADALADLEKIASSKISDSDKKPINTAITILNNSEKGLGEKVENAMSALRTIYFDVTLANVSLDADDLLSNVWSALDEIRRDCRKTGTKPEEQSKGPVATIAALPLETPKESNTSTKQVVSKGGK